MELTKWKWDREIELETFCEYWLKRNEEDSENYPLDIEPGEFDEQFAAWLSVQAGL